MLPAAVVKILKPVGAGLALAYLATALVDGPPPVNFSPKSPYSAKQAEIVEPQAAVVIEKNIMKLGSLLSVSDGSIVLPEAMAHSVDEMEMLELPDNAPGPQVKGEVTPAPAP